MTDRSGGSIPGSDHVTVARDCYRAFATGDRELIERCLDEELEFSSPLDVGLDRAGYFESCWPHAGELRSFELRRLIEAGDEVLATYDAARRDGTRFRNTEVLTFRGDRVRKIEVYFGWILD
jgi:ketosteroid isomerase-like protein